MKKITYLLLLCSLSLSAAKMQDPIKNIKTSYQTIKESYGSKDNQFLKIVKNEKVNNYLKDTPLNFWINAMNNTGNGGIKTKSTKITRRTNDVKVLDSVVIDISDLELDIEKGLLVMDYNDETLCSSIEVFVVDTDTSICIGGMYLSYNEAQYIDTITIKIINGDGDLSTAGTINAIYNNNNYITQLKISINYEDQELYYEDAIQLNIAYDDLNQLSQVNLYSDPDFTTYVTYNLMGNEDSITFEEERVALAEIKISRNENNDITCLYGKYNDVEDTLWRGIKIDVEYDGTLITQYSNGALRDGAWEDDSVTYHETFEYDEHNNLTKYYESNYDTDDKIRYYNRAYELFYNEDNVRDSIYSYSFDRSIATTYPDSFALNYKFYYEYDAENNLSSITELSTYENDWRKSDRFEYSYDINNLLTSYSYGTYEKGIFLEYDDKYTFEYNDENRISSIITYDNDATWHYSETHILDSITQNWEEEDKTSLTWDNEFITAIQQEYHESDNWCGRAKADFSRDNYENFTGGKYYRMEEGSEVWEQVMALNIEYNLEIEVEDIGLPQLITDIVNHGAKMSELNPNLSRATKPRAMIPLTTESFGYVDINDALNGLYTNLQINNAPNQIKVTLGQDDEAPEGLINFYYSTIGVATNNGTSNKLSLETMVYPNPASTTINIEGTQEGDIINIYDLSGKQVMQKSLVNTSAINISSLIKGLYLYSVSSGDTESKGKLVVE